MSKTMLSFIAFDIQSTVNGVTMVHGHLAHKHVTVERNLAQEKWPHLHPTEDNHVMEQQRKLWSAIRKPAL